MKVGVIGLGNMGMGAALNLLKKGHDVTGCELREETRAAFMASGGAAVDAPGALPADLEAVVVFVINAAQTEQVLFGEKGCLARMPKGSVVLCCATVAPEAAKALGRRIEDAGFLMLDSPVSGGSVGAREGTMTVMGSGSEAAFAKAGPVLEAISTKVWRLGDQVGVGSTGEDGQPTARRCPYRDGRGSPGAGHSRGCRPYHAVQGDLGLGRQFVDVAEPGATYPGRRRHTVVGGQYLCQGSGDRAGPGPGPDLPAAAGLSRASMFLAAAANGQGLKDDAFVIRVWQALTGIELPDGK